MTTPTSPLRERRRQQTAEDIHHATLILASREGYAKLTTERIAEAAGISLRTFFNYYPNKEAALIGPPPQFDATALAEFIAADGDLIADFARLVGRQLAAQGPDKEKIRAIDAVIRELPEIELPFLRSLSQLSDQLAGALACRLGARGEPACTEGAGFLAEVMIMALSRAFRDWAHDEAMRPEEAMAQMQGALRLLAWLLGPGICGKSMP